MTGSAVRAAIVSQRLYGIEFRPQEFDLYADHLTFDLRSAIVADDPSVIAERHWRLCVLEAVAAVPPTDGIAGGTPRRLRVLRCGWELELEPDRPCAGDDLPDDPTGIAAAVERIAETVNLLARRAGFTSDPLGPETVTTLLHRYHAGVPS